MAGRRRARIFTFYMEAKYITTRPLGWTGRSSQNRVSMRITRASPGAGTAKVSGRRPVDSGIKNWQKRQLAGAGMTSDTDRLRLAWQWRPASRDQTRSTTRTDYVAADICGIDGGSRRDSSLLYPAPLGGQKQKRGKQRNNKERSFYHNNAISRWTHRRAGEGDQCQFQIGISNRRA